MILYTSRSSILHYSLSEFSNAGREPSYRVSQVQEQEGPGAKGQLLHQACFASCTVNELEYHALPESTSEYVALHRQEHT
jgi:hypothetical protein